MDEPVKSIGQSLKGRKLILNPVIREITDSALSIMKLSQYTAFKTAAAWPM